jgi:hypothetical protein
MRVMILAGVLALATAGCTETYCQSGPKYGTQCYDLPRGEEPPHPQYDDSEGSGGAAPAGRAPSTAPR